jgi:hypothetical protein
LSIILHVTYTVYNIWCHGVNFRSHKRTQYFLGLAATSGG